MQRRIDRLQAPVRDPHGGVETAGELQVGEAGQAEPAGEIAGGRGREVAAVQIHLEPAQAGVGTEIGIALGGERFAVAPGEARDAPARIRRLFGIDLHRHG